jgi:Lipocalin-like domain
MKIIVPIIFLLAIAAIACQKDDKKALLIGQWQGTAWTVRGEASGRNAGAVQFQFNADGTYATSYEDQSEKGTFRLSGDKLYTIGENKIEKMVKLATFTADTLVMDMNRVGDAEELTLVKKH